MSLQRELDVQLAWAKDVLGINHLDPKDAKILNDVLVQIISNAATAAIIEYLQLLIGDNNGTHIGKDRLDS